MHAGDEIDRALASAQRGDIEQARAILEAAKRERTLAMTKARHDMGNALSVAQSSIEAMLDGVEQVRHARLERLLEIIKEVSAALYEVTAEAGEPATAISLESLAKVKSVRLVLDSTRSIGRLQPIVMQAIRHALPGTTIQVGDSAQTAIIISLRPHSAKAFIEALGVAARQIETQGADIRVLVELSSSLA